MSDLKQRQKLLALVKTKQLALNTLQKAQGILKRGAWFGGNTFTKTKNIVNPDAICAQMAINQAAGHGDRDAAYYDSFAEKLVIQEVKQKNNYCSIPDWNDDPTTTKREVLSTFGKIINNLKTELHINALK